MNKLRYEPVSLLVSVLGGAVAGALFKRAWRLVTGASTRQLTGARPGGGDRGAG